MGGAGPRPGHRLPRLSGTLGERLRVLAECTVCLEPMQDPVTLPCGHTLCRGCCAGLLGPHGLRCPLDRSVHPAVPPAALALRGLLQELQPLMAAPSSSCCVPSMP